MVLVRLRFGALLATSDNADLDVRVYALEHFRNFRGQIQCWIVKTKKPERPTKKDSSREAKLLKALALGDTHKTASAGVLRCGESARSKSRAASSSCMALGRVIAIA